MPAIDETIIDYMIKGLKDFSLKWISFDNVSKDLSGIATVCSEIIQMSDKITPLEIGKNLKQFLNIFQIQN